jgi:glycosyltransferase involved in cell wall biosynthesis
VRNGQKTIEDVARSVLRQDCENLELIISDNASSDGTEAICRELAASDARVRYVRQPHNIGLVENFKWVRAHARGAFFRWIGDDDEISPDYVSRCVEVLCDDPRLVLVTTQLAYTEGDGQTRSLCYDGTGLGSHDPAVRFAEMLRLLTETYLLLDPVYGMFRREPVADIPYKNMLRGDEVFAAKVALAGSWAHIPQVLAHRHWDWPRPAQLTRLLDVPPWHWRVANLLQCRELLSSVREAELTPEQRRRARAAIVRLYVRRHRRTAAYRGGKLVARVRSVGNRR